MALSTHATTSSQGAAAIPLTRSGGYGGQTEKVRKRITNGYCTGVYVRWRVVILLLIVYVFLISQYACHPGRSPSSTSSILDSTKTSSFLHAKHTTAASVLLYSPRYSRRPIPIRRRYHKHQQIDTSHICRLQLEGFFVSPIYLTGQLRIRGRGPRMIQSWKDNAGLGAPSID